MKNLLVLVIVIGLTTQNIYSQHIIKEVQVGWSFKEIEGTKLFARLLKLDRDSIVSSTRIDLHAQQHGGSTQINDAEGNLLLFTEGWNIQNRYGEIIENGDSISQQQEHKELGAGNDYTQLLMFLPYPEKPNYYVLVHTDAHSSSDFKYSTVIDTIFYSIINMNENNGRGKVISKDSILDSENALWKSFDGNINCIRHANGRDWWVSIWQRNAAKSFSWLLDPDGFRLINTQEMTDIFPNLSLCSVFNPSGNIMIRSVVEWDHRLLARSFFEIHAYEFDRCSGLYERYDTSRIYIHRDSVFSSGLQFSETGRFLYAGTGNHLWQYDTWSGEDWLQRPTLASVIKTPWYSLHANNYSSMMHTYHGDMWVSSVNQAEEFHAIKNPESDASKEEILIEEVHLPRGYSVFKAMSHMPNYALGPIDGSSCDTLGINNEVEALFRYHIPEIPGLDVKFYDVSYFEPEEWEWDFGDGNSSTAEYPTHLYEEPGTYDVCLTIRNEYSEDTYCNDVTVYMKSTSVQEKILTVSLNLYPNPSTDILNIELKQSNGIQLDNSDYVIMTTHGKKIKSQSAQKESKINVSNLIPGNYLLLLVRDNRILAMEKFQKVM